MNLYSNSKMSDDVAYQYITDYHDIAARKIEAARQSGIITAAEERIIISYLSTAETRDISPVRYYKIAHYLLRIKQDGQISNYETATTEEIQTAFNLIKFFKAKQPGIISKRNQAAAVQLPQDPGAYEPAPAGQAQRHLSKNTISDMQRTFKAFCMWLSIQDINRNISPLILQQMKPGKPDLHTLKDSDLLTRHEIFLIFRACRSARDEALFRLMYSAALRVGEISALRVGDIITRRETSAADPLDQSANMVFIQTRGKTGKIRRIPIIDVETRRALLHWLKLCPSRSENPDNLLFTTYNNKPLSPATISMQLNRIAIMGGVTRHIHPHLFRHTRITELSRQGLDQAYIKQIAWGHQNTPMIDVYTHLSPDDIAAALIKINGDKQHGTEL